MLHFPFAQRRYHSWGKSGRLWLLANLLGTAGCTLLFYFSAPHTAEYKWGAVVGGAAAASSAPLVPLLRLAMGRLLAVPTRARRLAWTLGAVLGFFLLAGLVLALALGNVAYLALLYQFHGWVYLPAALLATGVMYADWLFRPGAQQRPTYAVAA
ncbi:hypothetical protein ACFQ48_13355 [Hymenobacter caeli]|uniref:MFS transporter n=1 Tax=Hymenobacter caeli TaxID=2735894 RepID=A0ABX2FTR0_9BACT|nr:hypothetical protein [Hymenobacter caeli]NRT20396.1 hypothetical protein [Hymenobacter caeli]